MSGMNGANNGGVPLDSSDVGADDEKIKILVFYQHPFPEDEASEKTKVNERASFAKLAIDAINLEGNFEAVVIADNIYGLTT
jgi:hypothetical protein